MFGSIGYVYTRNECLDVIPPGTVDTCVGVRGAPSSDRVMA